MDCYQLYLQGNDKSTAIIIVIIYFKLSFHNNLTALMVVQIWIFYFNEDHLQDHYSQSQTFANQESFYDKTGGADY